MGNQGFQTGTAPDPAAASADPSVAGAPAGMGEQNAEPQNFEELYRQAMEDNSTLSGALQNTQQALTETQQRAQMQAAANVAGRMDAEERAFWEAVRELSEQEKETAAKQFYGQRQGQIFQAVQASAQQNAYGNYLQHVAQQHGLSQQEMAELSMVHPSNIEFAVQTIVGRKQQMAEMNEKINKLTAGQVVQGMQQSGAYVNGGGNIPPQGAVGGQSTVVPGSKEHLLELLRSPAAQR